MTRVDRFAPFQRHTIRLAAGGRNHLDPQYRINLSRCKMDKNGWITLSNIYESMEAGNNAVEALHRRKFTCNTRSGRMKVGIVENCIFVNDPYVGREGDGDLTARWRLMIKVNDSLKLNKQNNNFQICINQLGVYREDGSFVFVTDIHNAA